MNVVTPLQSTLSDGAPLVVFSDRVVYIVGTSQSCMRKDVPVKDIAELSRRTKEAFRIAMAGPVLVDLPKYITARLLRAPLPFTATTSGAFCLPTKPLIANAQLPTDLPMLGLGAGSLHFFALAKAMWVTSAEELPAKFVA
ncbi:hypothetical protein PHLGIDRAFT_119954 [Phlebiopsis gigantea 11061_1 CR5-6]|uniref:Uncharacterized protein n=1 Tax=Phlebiopsis gigantea (strain 11061_1 CR5-6) TaxID=745531 RepID=A0A0C3S8G3_PHLG1|nr:hypothetical protein PHLGIDRAFT_119954 [Phlebiopsis gigantea 11061_1 CR5-6]